MTPDAVFDDEARDEAAWELCVGPWGMSVDVEKESPSDFGIARMEVDLALDCYFSRLMAGDEQIDRAVELICERLWPGTWARPNVTVMRQRRNDVAFALSAASPLLLSWALKHASEQAGRAYDLTLKTPTRATEQTVSEITKES